MNAGCRYVFRLGRHILHIYQEYTMEVNLIVGNSLRLADRDWFSDIFRQRRTADKKNWYFLLLREKVSRFQAEALSDGFGRHISDSNCRLKVRRKTVLQTVPTAGEASGYIDIETAWKERFTFAIPLRRTAIDP